MSESLPGKRRESQSSSDARHKEDRTGESSFCHFLQIGPFGWSKCRVSNGPFYILVHPKAFRVLFCLVLFLDRVLLYFSGWL